MSWFNKKMNNNEEFETEDMLDEEELFEEESEEIPVRDKRRVTEDGERINVRVNEGQTNPGAAGAAEPAKSAEVVRLQNALQETVLRCEAAETKLVDVQKRFEEEKARLEQETAERRERMKRSLEQRAEQGRLSFLQALLPVLDNLNLAIDASEKDSSFENLLTGVQGTARSFEQALMKVGVQPIPAVGQPFDPELHEALDMKEVGEEELDGIVTHEYSRGYTFNEKLLRPAKVQVGRHV